MARGKAKKSGDSPGIMDVSKPGKGTTSATSRPVIITNRPLLQDPMMVGEEATSPVPEFPVRSKATIQPITVKSGDEPQDVTVNVKEPETVGQPVEKTGAGEEQDKPTTDNAPTAAAEDEVDEAVSPPSTPPNVEPKPEPAPKPEEAVPEDKVASKQEAAAAEPAPQEEAETTKEDDEKVDRAAATTPEAQEAAAKKAEEAKAEHETAIEKLVENEQYFLPINSVESRKMKRFMVLGAALIVLLGAAWVDVALDAGLIQLGGLKPLTHFFRYNVVEPATTSSTAAATTNSFTAPLAQLTFHYPIDWQLSSAGSNAQSDTATLQPKVVDKSAISGVNVVFLSLPLANPSGTYTVKSVHYQKLTHKIADKNVYLLDIIYQDSAGKLGLTSSLTNDNSLKAGQATSAVQQSFSNVNGKNNYFGTSVVRVASGVASFTSLSDAQKFLQSHQYQQARSILLSSAPAKS